MGLTERLDGKRIYLDTNILIYAFEGYPAYAEPLRALFAAIDRDELVGVTSELTLAELLVEPLRRHLSGQADIYRSYMQPRSSFQVVPVSRPILVEAARLRATTQLKLPDAIHVATASQQGCSTFLTNDARIRAPHGIDLQVIRLADVV